ncbi:ABC transporter ATP-binding protein [Streptomyces celluloflavus]|uniref:ABC transporter ATP-binding protein n=1 Tax=Streptomyces celluloflavus TaxID=58344 RepID=UPI003460048E|nr:ATP-binding cassette domain-containing protein [Streptomyces celluloflavus]
MTSSPVLELDSVSYAYRGSEAAVVAGISLVVTAGQSLALVGESGAGKTTLLRMLLGLARPTSGEVRFDGDALRLRDREQMRRFRRSVQCVFQDPYASLDPRQQVRRIVGEPLRSLRIASGAAAGDLVGRALERVGLPADAADRYPHEFSGGQRQRIAIARATVCDPRILLADEPVSALDVTTRVKVVDLLAELKETTGLTVVMVSHDLSVVAALCEHTAVLERGRVVESGATRSVLGAPSHGYTRRLLSSVPRLPVGG